MGDINQLLYLRKFLPVVDGPILEIGSKDYGSTTSFRDVYTGNPYTGTDMEDGKGVDVVLDLTRGTGDLPTGHFALGVCCSVLEHVIRPWIMAANITALIRPQGKLFMSVPWVWRYHAYPDDYFRFSFRGIMALFPEFTWEHVLYSTSVQGEFFPVTEQNLGVDNSLALLADTGRGQRKYLPYLMVNMIGTKKETA